jgi:hypothetical protein
MLILKQQIPQKMKRRKTMKKLALIIAAATLALSAPAAFAADHEGHDHGSMDMGHGDHSTMSMGKAAHEEVVDGVKATFNVFDIQQRMKEMGMKETHHIMVMFTDAKTGKQLSSGEVKIKVLGPDKYEQVKDLMGMEGGFGSDFTLPKKGKYGVMCRFKLADGKVRNARFWYTVK